MLCVSRTWQDRLASDYGIAATAVNNGVDTTRFSPDRQPGDEDLRQRLGLNRNTVEIGRHAGTDCRHPDDKEVTPNVVPSLWVPAFPAGTTGLCAISAELDLNRSGPLFLAVGGIEARKNTLRIFQAFTRVLNRLPQAQLVIAGGASLLDHSGYRREFDRVVAESGIPTGPGQPLILTGPLADADMPALFRLADALVFPSLQEGFGLVALEAIVSGTPVVVSRRPPFTEYLEESDCRWADPEDCDSIAIAMADAATAFPTDRLTAIARRLSERYSWANSARTHLDVYRSLISKGDLAHA
ncbi:MAG: glycosyltransferase [Methylococcaceae bacterium]|nr:glycosyltransferase [Methylococcaceae bacterium]